MKSKGIKKLSRSSCKECPWKNSSGHSKSWSNNVDVMTDLGQIKDRKHACHMITSDVWGYKNKINDSNICIGSKER